MLSNILIHRRLLSAVVFGAAMVFAGANRADAALTLEIQHGGDIDGAASGTNFVSFSGTVGDYMITFAGGSANVPGGATAFLDISTLTITRVSAMTAGDLFFRLAGTGFTSPSGNFLVNSVGGTFRDATAGDSLSFQSFFDAAASGVFGAGVGTPIESFVAAGAGGTEGFGSGAFPPATPVSDLDASFSLSSITRVNLAAVGSSIQFVGTATVQAEPGPGPVIPEPSSIALLGLGGLGLVGRAVRRRRAVKAAA